MDILLKDDFEKEGLSLPEITAKLLCSLEAAMHRAMKDKSILQL